MPEFDSAPYWWEAAPPEVPSDPPSLPASADVAVIGAGYTGLAAARTLAAAGRDTVVLDALPLGHGASTRNGGMAGGELRLPLPRLEAKFGRCLAARLVREARTSVEALAADISALGIDCDFKLTGRLMAAWTQSHFEDFKRRAEQINSLAPGEATILPRQQMLAEELASRRYFGGMLVRTQGGAHPAKLHRGLLAAARARGARILPQTPVLGFDRRNATLTLRTTRGELRAADLIVATNGYTGSATPWLARRLMPVPSYIIASEPLSEERMRRMIPGARMIVETRARYAYYRRSPDGARLIFGGRASVARIPLPLAKARLKGMVDGLFPEAARGLRYTHCWTGFVAFSGNMLPYVHAHDGVQYVGGYCGSGVAMSSYLGRKAALRVLGDPDGDTAFAEIPVKAPLSFRLSPDVARIGAEALLRCRDIADRAGNKASRALP